MVSGFVLSYWNLAFGILAEGMVKVDTRIIEGESLHISYCSICSSLQLVTTLRNIILY